jgi:hypothetical protein
MSTLGTFWLVALLPFEAEFDRPQLEVRTAIVAKMQNSTRLRN